MSLRHRMAAALTCLLWTIAPIVLWPGPARAQSSYIAPDGHNRYPAVTIFCPSNTGVVPCAFSGSANSVSTIDLGGSAVSGSNRFPVTDPALDALISGGALKVSGGVSQSGSWNMAVSALPALPAGSNSIGTVSVANFPATQQVSLSALPLPSGAATSTTNTPVAPGTATATNATLLGCLSNTTLPSFTAGQQGAVPCDSSGRPYVVTVPSANNVPSYLQAVSSGGYSTSAVINSANSAMATVVKSSGGMVYGYSICNAGSGTVYARLFNQSAAPTVGSSTPIDREIVPAGQCARLATVIGMVFSSGIGLDVTSGSLADSDTATIAAASSVSAQVFYK